LGVAHAANLGRLRVDVQLGRTTRRIGPLQPIRVSEVALGLPRTTC